MMIIRLYHGLEFVRAQATVYEDGQRTQRGAGRTLGTYSQPLREDQPLVEQYCRCAFAAAYMWEQENRETRESRRLEST